MNVLKLAVALDFPEWQVGDMIPRFTSSGEYVETVLWTPGVLTVSPQNWELWQTGMKRFCFFNPVTSCFFFRGPWSFKFRAFGEAELGKIFNTLDTLSTIESLFVEDINEVISFHFVNMPKPTTQTQSALWDSVAKLPSGYGDIFDPPSPPPLSSEKLESLLQSLQKANKPKSIKVNWVLSSKGVIRHEV